MLSKFKEMSQKEQNTFIAVCILSVVFYIAIIVLPPLDRIHKAEKKLSVMTVTAVEIEKGIAEYRSLPDDSAPKRSGSLLSAVEKTAAETSISRSIAYLKPFSAQKGLDGAEIKLNNITGKDIVEFIDKLQKQQVNITKINMKDNDLDGLWTVRLFMEG